MKVHIVVLIVLFSVMFRNVCGQTVGVRGAMSEEVRGLAGQVFSDQKGVVPYAHVFFIHGKDTIPLVCDAIGVFSWHTAHVPDTLRVRVTAIGYKTLEAHYYPKTQGNRLLIRIQQEAVALNEVIVTAKKVYMVVKGDTLEYKAETFMALEGDFIGNLLKKLPGVSFENGLTINGEPIARIYVNGEDFGGTGNVLSNIKADNVKDIQVYDERNKEDLANGMKYGRRETVMNVVTKKKVDRWKDWRNGTFLLGTGRDVSNNSTSRFKQKLNLKFNYKMPLENADSKLKTGKSLNIEGEYTNIGKTNDVQASKFTLTYRNKFQGLERDKKLYYKTNNTFTNNRNYSRILNNRVYFPTSDYTSRVYEARKVDEQEMWQFDTKHHFAYKQMHWSLGIRSEKKEEDRNSQERSETNDSLISAVSMQYRLKNVNSSGNAELSLILLKKINFNSSFDFGQRKTESLQIDTISESNRHFLLDQKYDHQNMEWTTTISYGRMLSLFSSLFEYTYRTSMNKENGESVNRLTNSLDTNGTRDYSFYQQIHELSGRLNYYSKKTSILANITLQRLFRNRVERFPHRVQLRDDFLPLRVQLTIEMKSSPTFNWNMGYQLTPSISGLANTRREIETSNPMFLHAGNPNLKPSKSHMIYVTFNQLFVSKASHLMGVVNYSLETDYFAMSERYFPQTTYLPEYDYTVMAGATLMVPRNTKAHHQLLVNATYSTYSGLLKSKLNIKTIYEYKKIPSFTQGQVNDQQTNKWSLGLGLITSFSRKVEFNLSSYTSVLNTQSDLDRANNILTQNASLAFRSRIISKYTFSATYSYAYSKNYATGHDTGLPELKMEIERNLGRFTSLKLEGINLLNRQNGVSFGKTATFTSRTESARTGGYVMLTFSQKLR